MRLHTRSPVHTVHPTTIEHLQVLTGRTAASYMYITSLFMYLAHFNRVCKAIRLHGCVMCREG